MPITLTVDVVASGDLQKILELSVRGLEPGEDSDVKPDVHGERSE